MSTSLQTTNYGFGKYAPDDLTSYLTDYNRAMDKIDGAIKGVSDVANEAKATGDSNLNNIASLSQELTATNKNVENLGKAQTAQKVEIDDLKTEVSSVVIGKFAHINFTPANNVSNIAAQLRKVGNGVQGAVNFNIASGTYTGNRSYLERTLADIMYIAGNIFDLNGDELQVSQLPLVVSSGHAVSDEKFFVIYFDSATNMTRIGMIVTGSTEIEQNSKAYLIF